MKTKLLTILLLLSTSLTVHAQGVAIGTGSPVADSSAILDVQSTNSGVLFPRLTSAQRALIGSPAEGLTVYDTDLDAFYFYSNGNWTKIGSSWNHVSNGVDTNYVHFTGDVAVGHTGLPQADVHIQGSTTLASLQLSPNEPFSGDDSELIFTEDDDNTYNMKWRYDGGDNRLYAYGKNNASTNGPHFGINRDNGRVGIGTGTMNPVTELEVVGTVTATAFSGDGDNLHNIRFDNLSVGSTNINSFMEQGIDTNAHHSTLVYNKQANVWQANNHARVAFHASASTDQTVGDTAYAWMLANNTSTGENFQYDGGYGDTYMNDTNECVGDYNCPRFVAPVDGIYFFEAAVLWDNANTAEARNAIFIRVNNTDEVGEWTVSGGTDFFGTSVSTTLELNADDEVSIRIYNGDNADMDTFSQSGKYCYWSGYLIFATE